jgi:hypothetical protein
LSRPAEYALSKAGKAKAGDKKQRAKSTPRRATRK